MIVGKIAIVIIGASCVIVGKIVHQLKKISKRRYKESVIIKKRKKRKKRKKKA